MNRNYLITLTIISLLAGAGIYFWNYAMPDYSNAHGFFILVYYVLFTIGIHAWLTKNGDGKSFVMRFMGITGIKLFLNLIVILVYGLNYRNKAVSFALMFLLIYFLFTIFESVQLMRLFKTKKS